MRILILTDLYPPHFLGGYELQCKFQAEELVSRGHEIHILTSKWGVTRSTIHDNVYRLLNYNPLMDNLHFQKISCLPPRLLRRFQQIKWAFSCRRNYRITLEILTKVKPDLAYIWNMGVISVSPVLAVQKYGIPQVFNVCDYWLTDLKTELCQETNHLKRCYRERIIGIRNFAQLDLTHLLLPSQSMANEYTNLGFQTSKIKVIPNGLPDHFLMEIDALKKRSYENDRRKLVYIGRLVPQKGTDIAIDAFAHLINDMKLADIELDIIGEGSLEYEKGLRERVNSLGLVDYVHFKGKIDHQQVLESMNQYDVLLFTSRWKEPFGMIIVEAMARGLPVIASEVGATPEIIKDGENGFLVPPNEPLILAKAILRLVQNPTLTQKVKHMGLKTVQENYTNQRIIDQVEDYLHKVCH